MKQIRLRVISLQEAIDKYVDKKTKKKLLDRAERHDLKSLFFPLFLGGKRKGERITKVVILSHAFLLNRV